MSTFVEGLYFNSVLPRFALEANATINIGFVAPLTGDLAPWGLPGLLGCRLWQESLNARGGILISGRRYLIKIHTRDCHYDPDIAHNHIQAMVRDHNICFLLMHGGDSMLRVAPYLTEKRLLTTTLYPTDITPDTPYLIAPAEVHPLYNVTAIDWISRARPELRTIAICNQNDTLGIPSLAAYRAACKAAGITIVKEVVYDAMRDDPIEIVDAMLSASPDIMCWGTSNPQMIAQFTERLYATGQNKQIISATLDNYQRLIERTAPDFIEGTVFQFPDFDDPSLTDKAFFFHEPQRFYDEYIARYPDNWSAVSWEYASALDLWSKGVETAGSINPSSVLAALKHTGNAAHVFGDAKWWGEDVFGLDNVLIGDWPVVRIKNGQARIAEFVSIEAWLGAHEGLLKQEFSKLNLLWRQRLARSQPRVIPHPHLAG